MSEGAEDFMETIESRVFDEDKIVTYKWLSIVLGVHVNKAKRMLGEFLKDHGKEEREEKVTATYYISGQSIPTTEKPQEHRLAIVRDEEREAFKRTLQKVISEHVYSVQKGCLKDLKSLHLADYEKDTKSLQTGKQYGAIKCKWAKPYSSAQMEAFQEKSRRRFQPEPVVAPAKKKLPEPSKEALKESSVKSTSKDSEKESTPETRKESSDPQSSKPPVKEQNGGKPKAGSNQQGIASMFFALKNKQAQDKKPAGKKAGNTAGKNHRPSPPISSFFSRSVNKKQNTVSVDESPGTDSPTNVEMSTKIAEDKVKENDAAEKQKPECTATSSLLNDSTDEKLISLIECLSEKETGKEVTTTNGVGKMKSNINRLHDKPDKKAPGKKNRPSLSRAPKGRNQKKKNCASYSSDEEDPLPTKKRRRIIEMSDSESEESEEIESESPIPSPEVIHIEETKSPVESQEDSEEIFAVGKKRTMKMTTKTFEDDDGYFVTVKEKVTCTDSEPSDKEEEPIKAKKQEVPEASKKKKMKRESPPKTKQATLSSFFTRK